MSISCGIGVETVAVLYFDNIASDQESECLRHGIAEDIIVELSSTQCLKVFPRSATRRHRNKAVSTGEVGRELTAAHVLAGALQRVGKHLQITAQLVNARSVLTVWGKRYDRIIEDVFAVQDAVAEDVAAAVKHALAETAIALRTSTDKEQVLISQKPCGYRERKVVVEHSPLTLASYKIAEFLYYKAEYERR